MTTTTVLFATDFSASSEVARTYLANATWVGPAQLEVLHVMRDSGAGHSSAGAATPDRSLRVAASDLDAFTEPLARGLARTHVAISRVVRVGPPAEVIVQRARELRATLVVVGSRGRGALATALLGSVSTAIVEQSSSSVLVARAETVRAVLVADDGAQGGRAAIDAVRACSIFDALHLTIARVVDTRMPLEDSYLAERATVDRFEHEGQARVKQATRAVERRVAELRAVGRAAVGRVVTGEEAPALIGLATEIGADLIALGTGRSHSETRALAAREVVLGFRGAFLFARAERAAR